MHCVHIQINSFIMWSYPIIAQHSSCNLIETNQRFIVCLRCFYYILPNLRTQVCCEPNTDPFVSFLADIPWKYAVLLFPATPKYEQLNHQTERFQFGIYIRCVLFNIHLCTKALQYQTCYITTCLNHLKYSYLSIYINQKPNPLLFIFILVLVSEHRERPLVGKGQPLSLVLWLFMPLGEPATQSSLQIGQINQNTRCNFLVDKHLVNRWLVA